MFHMLLLAKYAYLKVFGRKRHQRDAEEMVETNCYSHSTWYQVTVSSRKTFTAVCGLEIISNASHLPAVAL